MNEIYKSIGENIKRIRKIRNMTLDELSERANVSKSMISEIERGFRNPSITIVWNLANALKVPLNRLLKGENVSEPTIYRVKQSVQPGGAGFSVSSVVDFDPEKKFEIFFCSYEPSTATVRSADFDGAEEYALVAQGTLTVNIRDQKYEITEGEVLRFSANQEHCYSNETDRTVKAYLLMVYPK